ncbi:MAG: RagB/SusD family nutrient uptake outer membrane protein [Gelidibacter sp.]|nr:RagB/SusD family nutrient uptake outer membrane protein [Gelidibacter sp.]
MKNHKHTILKWNYKVGILSLIVFLSLGSCTNLDEQVFSEITEKSFVATQDDIIALEASAYTPLRYIMGWQGLFDVQEEPGDMFVTPTRPNGWDDGGTYKRMHFHTWNDTQWQPRNTWLTCYKGINNINRVISQIQSGSLPIDAEKADAAVAEMRALRALYYSILIDTHGNVPILSDFSDEIPTQSTRVEVYNFIVGELTEVIPSLSEDVDKSTYGRLNKLGALQILARVYLNAQAYTGTPEWDKCIVACNEIINSGKYSLDPNYADIFKTHNETSPEIVFAVPYDEIYAGGWNAHMKMLSPSHRDVFNMQAQPWGGSSCNPQFIDSYEDGDKRLNETWLIGPQLDADTGLVLFTMVKQMPSIYGSGMYEGFRCRKYQIITGAKSSLSNDFPYFRYTDVLMMKAESLLRTGKSGEAAQLVTQVRMRSFDDLAKATVTGEELMGDTTVKYGTLDNNGNIADPGNQTPVKYGRFLDELGWEFAAEARRRTDMIRFGVYQTKSWYNHTPQGEYTTLFPIGLPELTTNPNLQQNPGY